jgi:hypothetical protein
MSPRRRPQSELPRQRQACLPRELVALYEQDADKGLSKRLTDNAFWLDDDADCELIEALHAIDQCGDKAPLICLLRARGNRYLADLLERYDLKRKRGRPQTPSYNKSDVEARLAMAVKDVRERGVAPCTAAERWRLDLRTLQLALEGRRGSSRRRAGTSPPLNTGI